MSNQQTDDMTKTARAEKARRENEAAELKRKAEEEARRKLEEEARRSRRSSPHGGRKQMHRNA